MNELRHKLSIGEFRSWTTFRDLLIRLVELLDGMNSDPIEEQVYCLDIENTSQTMTLCEEIVDAVKHHFATPVETKAAQRTLRRKLKKMLHWANILIENGHCSAVDILEDLTIRASALSVMEQELSDMFLRINRGPKLRFLINACNVVRHASSIKYSEPLSQGISWEQNVHPHLSEHAVYHIVGGAFGAEVNIEPGEAIQTSLGITNIDLVIREPLFTIPEMEFHLFMGRSIVQLNYNPIARSLHLHDQYIPASIYYNENEKTRVGYALMKCLIEDIVIAVTAGEKICGDFCVVEIDAGETETRETALEYLEDEEEDDEDEDDPVETYETYVYEPYSETAVESNGSKSESVVEVGSTKQALRKVRSLKLRKALHAFSLLGCEIKHGSNHILIQYNGKTTSFIGDHSRMNERIICGAAYKACRRLGIDENDFTNQVIKS